ncbi:hypothetical protein BpHYR1_012697 [Brachionus plicatilis]|uniref:Uncharacterized protein n=1 Tax=Brachionus plicatilis TaxID=10195 RepID=A0A3M7QHJ5_BRAPC|nr:hypothetical protein BpHYR1_012697 [Brachionus plicatilis]
MLTKIIFSKSHFDSVNQHASAPVLLRLINSPFINIQYRFDKWISVILRNITNPLVKSVLQLFKYKY